MRETVMEKIRVGVFGVGRGMKHAECFMLLNAEIVAICDHHKERREAAMKRLDISTYLTPFGALNEIFMS